MDCCVDDHTIPSGLRRWYFPYSGQLQISNKSIAVYVARFKCCDHELVDILGKISQNEDWQLSATVIKNESR